MCLAINDILKILIIYEVNVVLETEVVSNITLVYLN